MDKLCIEFVVTPIDKNNVISSIIEHENKINAFPSRVASGVYCAMIVKGTTRDYIVNQLVTWKPELLED